MMAMRCFKSLLLQVQLRCSRRADTTTHAVINRKTLPPRKLPARPPRFKSREGIAIRVVVEAPCAASVEFATSGI